MLRLILDICGVFFIAEMIIIAAAIVLAWNARRGASLPEQDEVE